MQELVVESLVVSLTLIMLDVLVNDEAQMPLAERDDTMEALLFDRPDEPLGQRLEEEPLGPRLALGRGDTAGDSYRLAHSKHARKDAAAPAS